MWGTDMSQTVTIEEGRAYVFVAANTRTPEIIGIHAARSPIASRGAGAGPAGGVSVLRLHRARRGAWVSCVTIMAPITCPAISRRDQMSGHRSFAVCGANPRAMASPSASSEPEGELALGADVQNHRGTLRAELVAFARAMTGRGMVAPAGSEEQTMHLA